MVSLRVFLFQFLSLNVEIKQTLRVVDGTQHFLLVPNSPEFIHKQLKAGPSRLDLPGTPNILPTFVLFDDGLWTPFLAAIIVIVIIQAGRKGR